MVVYVLFVVGVQKTAYDMRMSDWSSDVCTSDLDDGEGPSDRRRLHHPLALSDRRRRGELAGRRGLWVAARRADGRFGIDEHRLRLRPFQICRASAEIGRGSRRERGCQYGLCTGVA